MKVSALTNSHPQRQVMFEGSKKPKQRQASSHMSPTGALNSSLAALMFLAGVGMTTLATSGCSGKNSIMGPESPDKKELLVEDTSEVKNVQRTESELTGQTLRRWGTDVLGLALPDGPIKRFSFYDNLGDATRTWRLDPSRTDDGHLAFIEEHTQEGCPSVFTSRVLSPAPSGDRLKSEEMVTIDNPYTNPNPNWMVSDTMEFSVENGELIQRLYNGAGVRNSYSDDPNSDTAILQAIGGYCNNFRFWTRNIHDPEEAVYDRPTQAMSR